MMYVKVKLKVKVNGKQTCYFVNQVSGQLCFLFSPVFFVLGLTANMQ